MTKMPLSAGPCQNTFLGFLSHVTNSLQVLLTYESVVLTILEILGCLPFQESVILNYAPCMSGVEPGCDPRVR